MNQMNVEIKTMQMWLRTKRQSALDRAKWARDEGNMIEFENASARHSAFSEVSDFLLSLAVCHVEEITADDDL